MKLGIGTIGRSLVLAMTLGMAHMPLAWSDLPQENLSRIAKEISVTIDGSELGSGAIIGREGQKYYILTNWHVLKKIQDGSIATVDGQKHQILDGSIRQIQGLDLAVCAFISDRNYRIAALGNSDNVTEGTNIYITGAPANLNGIKSRSLLVVSGQVVGYDRPAENGYALIYNNNTMPGMSGGPAIDGNGNLIAIHGRGSRDANNQKSGFNLGIPINFFKQSATRLQIKYTAATNRIEQIKTPKISGSGFVGRPTVVDGSDGAGDVCVGTEC
jgi:serine protease Do